MLLNPLDVAIVGAGPAGLTAAVWLGRCRRSVLVLDDGRPRNHASHAIHGWLGSEGIDPAELRRRGRLEAEAYGVEFRDIRVEDARREHGGFVLDLADGTVIHARRLVLATGLTDTLPDVAGIADWYGRGVHHCPYCDAWDYRDGPIGVVGPGTKGLDLAHVLRQWSEDVIWFANGRSDDAQAGQAEQAGIRVRRERMLRVEGADGRLTQIVLRNGEVVPRNSLFFVSRRAQRSDLPERLGCRIDRGRVVANRLQGVSHGLYVAGDAARDVQFAVVAAAEGARAAYAIDRSLRTGAFQPD